MKAMTTEINCAEIFGHKILHTKWFIFWRTTNMNFIFSVKKMAQIDIPLMRCVTKSSKAKTLLQWAEEGKHRQSIGISFHVRNFTEILFFSLILFVCYTCCANNSIYVTRSPALYTLPITRDTQILYII